jgi:hypothetical protein
MQAATPSSRHQQNKSLPHSPHCAPASGRRGVDRGAVASRCGSNWAGLAVAVHIEIGKPGAVRRMEQFGRPRQLEQNVRLGPSTARLAARLGDGLIERRHPRTVGAVTGACLAVHTMRGRCDHYDQTEARPANAAQPPSTCSPYALPPLAKNTTFCVSHRRDCQNCQNPSGYLLAVLTVPS